MQPSRVRASASRNSSMTCEEVKLLTAIVRPPDFELVVDDPEFGDTAIVVDDPDAGGTRGVDDFAQLVAVDGFKPHGSFLL